MRMFLLAVLFSAPAVGLGQAPQAEKEPPSKAERFVSERGVVFVRTFANVGELLGQYGSKVAITANTYTRAQTGARQFAVEFNVTEGGDRRTARTERAVVDLDDLKDLLAALAHLKDFRRPSQIHGNFEASYHAQGGLMVSLYDDSEGDLWIAVTAGRTIQSSAQAPVHKLTQLIELVALAEDKLKALRAVAP